MKVFISEIMFDKLMKGCKGEVSITNPRPELTFIKIKVSGGMVTAYSCNGYTGTKMSFKVADCDCDTFECYIKPIPFKKSKSGAYNVTIELAEDRAILEIPEVYGTHSYKFKQPAKTLDYDKIFSSLKKHDREVGVNAAIMARLMRTITSVTDEKINKTAVIESKENPREGFCIRTIDNDFTFEQFLMPIRITDEVDR